MTNWTSPNTITGDAATGDRYLRRERINEYFWKEVDKGNHILFVAPRRVGKTSIMKDLATSNPDGYNCIYQNIEGIKSKNEFYQRLFELIVQCTSRMEKAKALIAIWLKRYSIEEITKASVKFKTAEVNYEKEFRNLIPELKDAKIKTVIFLDEFAEVINKLNKQSKTQDAVDILHTLREIRSEDDFRHFTLVFAGSIGLEYVIKSIDRPKLINDLHRVTTPELNDKEATQLITQLTANATIKFSDDTISYLKFKIQHLLPYYIQLMLEEIDLVAREADDVQITKGMIDQAFINVLKNNKNFDDWLERLKDYNNLHFPFMNEILILTAHKTRISVQEIYNIACNEKFNRIHDYMDIMEQLMHDGYLMEIEKHQYRFISPFLQQFWLKKFPVLYGTYTT